MNRAILVVPHLTFYRVPILEGLVHRGFHLTVLCEPIPEAIGFEWKGTSGPARFVIEAAPRRWRRFMSLLPSLGPEDVVIATLHAREPGAFRASSRARRRGVPWVWWGHSANFAGSAPSRWLGRKLRRLLLGRAAGVVAFTPGEAERWRELGARRVWVATNTVDVSELLAAFRAERETLLQAPAAVKGPVFAFLSRLYKQKRADLAIEAVRQARERLGSCRLLVIGGGPDQERLQARHAGEDWIRWTGVVEDQEALGKLLAGVDVVLAPGVVGLNLIQPFACGLPVVAMDIPGHGPEIEYLRSGETGLMVGSTRELADALVQLVKDRELHARLSNGAYRFWREHLQPRAMIDGLSAAIAEAPRPQGSEPEERPGA